MEEITITLKIGEQVSNEVVQIDRNDIPTDKDGNAEVGPYLHTLSKKVAEFLSKKE